LESRKGSFNERKNQLILDIPPRTQFNEFTGQPIIRRPLSVFDIGYGEERQRLREHLEASNARYLARRAHIYDYPLPKKTEKTEEKK
jgi:hypothetical protein